MGRRRLSPLLPPGRRRLPTSVRASSSQQMARRTRVPLPVAGMDVR